MNRERDPSAGPAPPERQAERLSALFELHSDRLYRLARRLSANPDDALDLVQDTFLKAARAAGSIPRELREQEAWLVRVLINVRRDQWRKERRRKLHDSSPSHSTGPHDDPERVLLIRTTVWRALDALPPRRRAIVVMHELEGLPIATIASLLGITGITVRWHLSKGRRELGRQLRFQLGGHDEQPQKSLARRRPATSRSSAP